MRQEQLSHTSRNYRADIDGIRGLAILSVVVFHLNAKLLPSGYTGVDFFFVISGFLISGIILDGLHYKSFRFVDFYSKRVRRIFPSLILMLFAFSILGWLFLFPAEFQELERELLAGSSFYSNFFFWKESGYFDSTAELKPLLNLWSLGVEEQFYIVWPMTLVVLTRLKIDFLKFVILITTVSFCLACFFNHPNHSTIFYMPWYRFWELTLGASLVKIQDFRLFKKIEFNPNWLSIFGLFLFTLSICGVISASSFPRLWALIPTLASSFLILGGPTSWINRYILGSSFLVFIGEISYPLYLWHWPMLSFSRIFEGEDGRSIFIELGVVMLAALIAWLSTRFFENSIRFGKNKSRQSSLSIALSIVPLIVFGFAGGTQLIKPRLANDKTEILAKAINDWEYPEIKFKDGKILTHILQGETDDTVLFLGDSHMEQYWPRFKRLYQQKQKMTVLFATYDGCLPLPNYHQISLAAGNTVKCDDVFDASMDMAISKKVKRVVFSGYWNGAINRDNFDRAMPDLEASLNLLHKKEKETVIILSNPTGGVFHPHSMKVSRLSGAPIGGNDYLDKNEFRNLTKNVLDELRTVAAKTNTKIIDPVDYMCPSDKCPVTVDGKPIYLDNDHIRPFYISEYGSFLDQTIAHAP